MTCTCAGRQTTLGSSWSDCLIPPEQLEICKRHSSNAKLPAQDWKLGSGAFGTVGCQLFRVEGLALCFALHCAGM